MASSINGSFSNQPIKGRKATEKTEAGGQDQPGAPIQDGFTASTPSAPRAPLSPETKSAVEKACSEFETRFGKFELTPPEGGYVNSPVYDPATGTLSFPNWNSGVSAEILAHEAASGWFSGATHEGAHLTGPGVAAGLQSIGAAPATIGLSDTAFTNGLSSTQLTSLSGRVLADLSPFKS